MGKDKFYKFLNSDRYQYTEAEIYFENGLENQVATFDVFVRTEKKNDYVVVYGIREVLELIDILNGTDYKTKKGYLKKLLENEELIEYLANMKFTGSIKGLRDGEIVFSNEPILTITAPIIQTKILETPILNILNYQMQIASISSRVVRAAKGRGVVFFGTRRIQGFESSMSAVKATYVTGNVSHSNLMGEYYYNLKSIGTMTHSYIQSFGATRNSEYEAFEAFIKVHKEKKRSLIMLIDTYDTLKIGIKNAVKAFKNNGIDDNYGGIYGIRIDSGDLAETSKACRKILKENGFEKAHIILTSGLDDKKIEKLFENGAEVDSFGVGDIFAMPPKMLTTVYKMAKINDENVMKISGDREKMSYPGDKEIYRLEKGEEGNCEKEFEDLVILEEERELFEDTAIEGIKKNRITVDFIEKGIKNEGNYKLLELEEAKKYYESNLKYLDMLENKGEYFSEKKCAEKHEIVKFSEKLENVRNSILEKIREEN
nr:nicotinate phosphoribosyltransferase [uncultured Leptotrichia sp.]